MFIQMVQGPCSRQGEMRGLVDDWCGSMADRPGWLGGTYGFTDDDRFLGIVRFDSSSACMESAATADAATWWAAAESLFDGTCEIHESEDVSMMLEGGSDHAGFVQVMKGRVTDADRFRHFMTDTEMTSMLHEARPEIIGATLAMEHDGTFLETIAFTDEDSARKGEQQDMPAEVQADPEVIRADIERTRSELSRDVNALGESVTPGNMARKGADKVRGRAVGLKDQIMGSASDATSTVMDSASDAGHATSQSASSMASSVGDATHGAASTVKRQARGNPLAAGLVALGAGWLLGSLLPASSKETQLAESVKDRVAPVLDEAQSTVKQMAQESAENLKQPAQEAVQTVKEHAQESAQTVKQEGQSAAQDVSDSAKSHADEAGATSGG